MTSRCEHDERRDGDQAQRPELSPPTGPQRRSGEQADHDGHPTEERHGRRLHPPPRHQVDDERRHRRRRQGDTRPTNPRRHGIRLRAASPPQHGDDDRPQGVRHREPEGHLRAQGPQGGGAGLEPDPSGAPATPRSPYADDRQRPPGHRGIGRPDPGQRGGGEVLQLRDPGLPGRRRGEQPPAVRGPGRQDRPRPHGRGTVADAGHDDVRARVGTLAPARRVRRGAPRAAVRPAPDSGSVPPSTSTTGHPNVAGRSVPWCVTSPLGSAPPMAAPGPTVSTQLPDAVTPSPSVRDGRRTTRSLPRRRTRPSAAPRRRRPAAARDTGPDASAARRPADRVSQPSIAQARLRTARTVSDPSAPLLRQRVERREVAAVEVGPRQPRCADDHQARGCRVVGRRTRRDAPAAIALTPSALAEAPPPAR